MLGFILSSSAKMVELTFFSEVVSWLSTSVLILAKRLTIAVLVLILGVWIIKWIRKLVNRFLVGRKIDNTVRLFLDSVVNITLKLLLILSIVNIIGISTMSFTAILAAVGLAVGMAMKDNLSNFAGGVMLLVNKPFKIGDRILAQNVDGSAQSIGILYTTIMTADNRTVYLPNGPLSTGTISNYSRQRTRRIDKKLVIRHGVDVEEVKRILYAVISSEAQVLKTPAPFVGLTAVSRTTIEVTIRVWVNSENFAEVSISLNELIYQRFMKEGVYEKI